MFGLVRIKDDRGVTRPLYEAPWWFKRRDRVAAQALREGMLFPRGQKYGLAEMAGGVVAGLGPLVGIVIVRPLGVRVMSSATMGWVAVGVYVVVWFAAVRTLGVYAARWRVKAAMLRFERCASCGYGLGEMQMEEDGCVVCAECGGAWRRGSHGG